jgi:hypothetical protein
LAVVPLYQEEEEEEEEDHHVKSSALRCRYMLLTKDKE